MHDIIQVVMGWWDYHLYEFEIGDRFYGAPSSDDALYDRKVYKASARSCRASGGNSRAA
jgi:hypothetical protein